MAAQGYIFPRERRKMVCCWPNDLDINVKHIDRVIVTCTIKCFIVVTIISSTKDSTIVILYRLYK